MTSTRLLRFITRRSAGLRCRWLPRAVAALLCSVSLAAFAADPQVAAFNDSPDPVPAGGNVSYLVRIDNNGADASLNTVMTMTVPAGAAFVSATVGTGSCSFTAPNVVCALGAVAPGGADVRDITVVLTALGPGPTSLALTASVSASNDINPGNNTQTQTTTVINGANLGLAKSGTPNPVVGGANITYTLTASNAGPNVTQGIRIVDTLSPSSTFVSASGSGWTCANAAGTVTCTRPGPHAVGAAIPPVTLVATVTASGGNITNTATIDPVVIGGVPLVQDPVSANNTTTATTAVLPGADVRIAQKSVTSAQPATAGQPVTFQIQPRNGGPATAVNAVVTDVLPANWVYVSASGPNWTCGASGQTVTCTRASFPAGATDNITIVANAPTNAQIAAGGQTFTNTASITNSVTDPVPGNNSGSVNVTVLRDGADLRVTKTKTPNPVAQGQATSSVMTLTNGGPRTATGPLRILDYLAAGETFVSASGSGWTCATSVSAGRTLVTCTHPNGGGLAVGASLPSVTVVATATAAGTLTNTACTGGTAPPGSGGIVSPPVEGDANPGNDCASASATSTTSQPDLSITKATTTPSGDKRLTAAEGTLTYTLVVRNNSATQAATGVRITDALPAFINGRTPAPTYTITVSGGSSLVMSCAATAAGVVTCNRTAGTLAPGGTVTVVISVQRPLNDGTFSNTATVANTVEGDPNPGNDSATDTAIIIDPLADPQVSGKTVSPSTLRAGENATYVISYRNNGPSTAQSVVVTDAFSFAPGDAGVTVVSITATGGATCTVAANAVLNPATPSFTCSKATMANNEAQTITLVVRPNFQSGNPARTIGNTASIASTTPDSNAANNSLPATLSVQPAQVDLLVNKVDLVDPIGFSVAGTFINYRLRVTNNGPSLGTNVTATESMQAPPGKRIRYICDTTTYGGTTCRAPSTCSLAANTTSAPGGTLNFTCQVPPGTAATGAALGTLVATQSKDINLRFQVLDAPAPGGDVYNNNVTVAANETDSFPGNNAASEPTTVRQLIDLRAAKTASAATVALNQPFNWTVTVTNAGPATSLQTILTDTLPAGAQVTGPITYTKTAPAGSGTCAVSGVTVTCTMGPLNAASATATVTIPVRFTAFPAGGTATNSATVGSNPADTGAIDSNPANNTATSTVTVTRSSLAGLVFRDRDGNGQPGGAGETGIGGVTLTLTGTDLYGNALTRTAVSAADGTYAFADLPPSNAAGYTITETQPAAFANGNNPVSGADSLGGTRPPGASPNFGIVISAIPVGPNVNGVNYNFPEILRPSISGTVYRDNNNNGVQNPGETGIAGATVQLYRASDSTLVATATTDANGGYSFSALAPTTYYLQELQPTGFLEGLATPGLIGGAPCVGCSVSGTYNPANEAASITRINGINVGNGDSATAMNFGELVPSSLAGSVFIDFNSDGVRGGGEPGIAGVTINLSGTDDRGNTVARSVITDGSGNYSIGSLRPANAGGYTLTEIQPAGFNNGPNPPPGAADSLGGTRPASGAGFGLVISAIPVAANQSGVNYTYGEIGGTTVSGLVFIDRNRDGILQAVETGRIPGVTIQLIDPASGAVIATAVTDASGNYSFSGAPVGSFRIFEVQPTGFGSSTPNTLNVTITAAGLTNQNFGDTASSVTGLVFLDANNNGTQQGGENGIAGNPIELLDASATVVATVNTDAGGAFRFDDLPAGTYALRQPTQPAGTFNGITTAGSAGGTASGIAVTPSTIGAIALPVAVDATGYRFAEIAPASLAGSVYNDANNNGVREPAETGYSGQTIALTGTNDLGQSISLTTTTDASGNYAFPGLRPGSYTIAQPNAPPGTLNGITTAGSAGGTATTVATTPSAISAIPLAAGVAGSGYLFGEIAPASISGSVYVDSNNNGQREVTEPGFAAQTITLTGSNDIGQPVSLSAVTDASGNFSFGTLRPGTYTLTQPAQPAGTSNGITTAGSTGGSASAVTTLPSTISGIVLPAAAASTGNLFGERPSGAVSGSVYLDLNNNGVREPTEAGIAGQTITLNGTSTLGQAVSLSAVTDAAGNYVFNALLPGTYTLTQPAQPPGTLNGITSAGSTGGSATPVTTTPSAISGVVLAAGSGSTDNRFGELPAASLSGSVYNDVNNNGVREPTESGFAGNTIQLSGNSDLGAVALTTTTDANGNYSFGNLRPGTYVLTQPVQPAAVVNGITTAGSAGGTATAVSVLPSAISGIALAAGVGASGYTFGEIGNAVNLVVSKQAGGPFATGNRASYTIVVANLGQLPSSGAYTVEDRLPAGLTLAETPSGSGWNCSGAAGATAFTCTSSSVIAAASTSANAITAAVNVAATATGGAATATLNNPAIVSGGGEPPAYAPTPAELANFAGNPAALPACAPVTAPLHNACRAPTAVQQSASVGGNVWLDLGTVSRQLDAGDQPLAGWTVEIIDAASNAVARSAQTGADGAWRATDLVPGRPYLVRFRDASSGIYWGIPVSGNAGTPPVPCVSANPNNAQTSSCVETAQNSQLRIVLQAGDNVLQQSLPVDPSGVVYDSIARVPVPGAVVTLAPVGSCPGYDPAQHIANAQLGGYTLAGNAVSMTVGAQGAYLFLLNGNAPARCTFGLSVAPPASHTFVSQVIAPQANALATPPAPGTVSVQPQAGAPAIGQSTTYYLSLAAGSGTQNIVHNHIPLDPRAVTGLVVAKTGSTQIVELGDSLQYTVRVRNTTATALAAVYIDDALPAGFRFIPGTAFVTRAGAREQIADPSGSPGPNLTFAAGALPANAEIVLTYRVRVGVGAAEGNGINTAQAKPTPTTNCAAQPQTCSNTSQFQVRVQGGVFTTDACVAGKVFVDCNGNHVQDAGEPGIPGVRLWLQDGTFFITDSEGKYSYCGIRPLLHVMKVDRATLPTGSRLTESSNRNVGDPGSLMLDIKKGELHRADFIEGSCSAPVLEQVQARRAQGEVAAPAAGTPQGGTVRFSGRAPAAPPNGSNTPQPAPRSEPNASTSGAPDAAPPAKTGPPGANDARR